MSKYEKKRLSQEINKYIDEVMYECFVDIPQTFGFDINEHHEYILAHILNRIKNHHDEYFVEN